MRGGIAFLGASIIAGIAVNLVDTPSAIAVILVGAIFGGLVAWPEP